MRFWVKKGLPFFQVDCRKMPVAEKKKWMWGTHIFDVSEICSIEIRQQSGDTRTTECYWLKSRYRLFHKQREGGIHSLSIWCWIILAGDVGRNLQSIPKHKNFECVLWAEAEPCSNKLGSVFSVVSSQDHLTGHPSPSPLLSSCDSLLISEISVRLSTHQVPASSAPHSPPYGCYAWQSQPNKIRR